MAEGMKKKPGKGSSKSYRKAKRDRRKYDRAANKKKCRAGKKC